MNSRFVELYEKHVHPHMLQQDWEKAIEALQQIMPQMQTDTDRACVYAQLAPIHTVLYVQAIQAGDMDEAREQTDLAEEFYVKALAEDASRPDARLGLARLYLGMKYEPQRALELVEIDDANDLFKDVDADMAARFEHQAHVLRGVTLVMLKREEDAAKAFGQALAPELLKRLGGRVDYVSMRYLAASKITVSAQTAEVLRAALPHLNAESRNAFEELLGMIT